MCDGDVEAAKAARVSLPEGSPELIDAGLEKTLGDSLPKVRAINGNIGAIGLAERDNGRVSLITLWDSGDSMRASAQEADQLRQRTVEISEQTSRTSRNTTSRWRRPRPAHEPELGRGPDPQRVGPLIGPPSHPSAWRVADRLCGR
jgi:hypothetical protein